MYNPNPDWDGEPPILFISALSKKIETGEYEDYAYTIDLDWNDTKVTEKIRNEKIIESSLPSRIRPYGAVKMEQDNSTPEAIINSNVNPVFAFRVVNGVPTYLYPKIDTKNKISAPFTTLREKIERKLNSLGMETWHPTHCTKINKILGELEFGFDNDGEKINYINKIIKTDLKNKLENGI